MCDHIYPLFAFEGAVFWDRMVVSRLVTGADCAAKRSDGYYWVLLFWRLNSLMTAAMAKANVRASRLRVTGVTLIPQGV